MHTNHEKPEISYFFSGEFREYRNLFAAYCPPPMKMHKGMLLCRHGETKGWMYYLCRGQVKVYVSNYQGNERMVAILGEDSVVGLDCFLGEKTSLMNIECMTDCWIMPLQSSTMEALIRENPDFAVDLTRYYCKVMRQLCFDAENQSISSILIRLSNFLKTTWDDAAYNRVSLSQQELAAAVKCSRASIARVCSLLKKEGVIAPEGVGFRLLNLAKLDELCQKYQ